MYQNVPKRTKLYQQPPRCSWVLFCFFWKLMGRPKQIQTFVLLVSSLCVFFLFPPALLLARPSPPGPLGGGRRAGKVAQGHPICPVVNAPRQCTIKGGGSKTKGGNLPNEGWGSKTKGGNLPNEGWGSKKKAEASPTTGSDFHRSASNAQHLFDSSATFSAQ